MNEYLNGIQKKEPNSRAIYRGKFNSSKRKREYKGKFYLRRQRWKNIENLYDGDLIKWRIIKAGKIIEKNNIRWIHKNSN